MKKILFILMAALMFGACQPKAPAVVEPIEKILNVDELISADNADMSAKYDSYIWYETDVQLKNFLDEEYNGVQEVTNVFQTVTQESPTTFDTFVYLYEHTTISDTLEVKHSFWVEDYPLDQPAVSFEMALSYIQQTNYPKPHSRQVVLRKEIGPVECNPQWIFGNIESQLYVDAVTGKVSPTNPAFPE